MPTPVNDIREPSVVITGIESKGNTTVRDEEFGDI
jgi:hypothetical protein